MPRLGSPAFSIYSLSPVVAPERSQRSTASSVCAIVPRRDEPFARALAAQSHQPAAVVCADSSGRGLAAALAKGAQWVWLLDGSAVPRPDALQELLGALRAMPPLPPPPRGGNTGGGAPPPPRRRGAQARASGPTASLTFASRLGSGGGRPR